MTMDPDDEKSKVNEELKLLPHLVHTKLGNALLLQFILSDKDQDDIGLRYWGFSIGLVTLAICLHASTMGFIFKSFTKVFTYKQEKVRRVRETAHLVNNTLCCIQVIVTNILFVYCLIHKNDVVYSKEEKTNGKYFVEKRIFTLTLYISIMVFSATLVAILAVVYLYCIHGQLMKNLLEVKNPKFDADSHLPPASSYVIEIGLANVLLNLFIGIDETRVGELVHLQDLALWVGVITMLMVMLDNIITLTLFISMSDGKLDLWELRFFKAIHLLRYLMAMIQVAMFCAMLGLSLFILSKGEERKIETSPYRTPDNLLELSLVLSIFVVGGSIFASIVIIYLTCSC